MFTQVGYGDYYPTSLLGYIAASILTFVSVLFLALPVGIIGWPWYVIVTLLSCLEGVHAFQRIFGSTLRSFRPSYTDTKWSNWPP